MSSLGHSGNGFQSYSTDLTIAVGLAAPNVNPTEIQDEVGERILELKMTSNGTTVEEDYRPSSRSVDNSWLSHGGLYTVAAGNKITFTSGAGGFFVDTFGPMFLHAAGIDVFTGRVNIKASELTVGAVNVDIIGGKCQIRPKTTFYETTSFLKNVVINGGLYVNGEAFLTHATSIGKEEYTDNGGELNGYINPAQSFAVYNGCSNFATTSINTPWKKDPDLPTNFGYIDSVIALKIPNMEGVYQLPCKIAFPNGISMASDTAVIATGGTDIVEMEACPTRIPLESESDIKGPGHSHKYIGTGTQTDGSDAFQKGGEECSSDTPVGAKIDEELSVEHITNKIMKAQIDPVKKWFTDQLGYIGNLISGFTSSGDSSNGSSGGSSE